MQLWCGWHHSSSTTPHHYTTCIEHQRNHTVKTQRTQHTHTQHNVAWRRTAIWPPCVRQMCRHCWQTSKWTVAAHMHPSCTPNHKCTHTLTRQRVVAAAFCHLLNFTTTHCDNSLEVSRQPLLSKYLSIKEGEQVLRRQFKSPAPGAPAQSNVGGGGLCIVCGVLVAWWCVAVARDCMI